MESLKHKYAKNAVADWMRREMVLTHPTFMPWAPREVFVEYPICLSEDNHLIPEWGFWGKGVPTYEQCLEQKFLPLVIFDVVGTRKGHLFAIEVVYKHDITPQKDAYLDRICREADVSVYRIDAEKALAYSTFSRSIPPLKYYCGEEYTLGLGYGDGPIEGAGNMLDAVKAALAPDEISDQYRAALSHLD